MSPENGNGPKTVKTNPDPTKAVSEALALAVHNITETINRNQEESERAITLARQELENKLTGITNSIGDKFIANKDLVDQLAKANSTALQAALQTQQDLLRQLKDTFGTEIKNVNEKIDRLTSRADRGEGDRVLTSGQVVRHDIENSQATANRQNNIAVVAIIVGALGILIGLAVTFVLGKHP